MAKREARFTELLQINMIPSNKARFEARARAMGLTPTNLARWALNTVAVSGGLTMVQRDAGERLTP